MQIYGEILNQSSLRVVHLYEMVSYHDPSGNNPFNLNPPKSGSVVLLKP